MSNKNESIFLKKKKIMYITFKGILSNIIHMRNFLVK